MSDRVLISLACLPMMAGLTLLVMLSRVPATLTGVGGSAGQQAQPGEQNGTEARRWVGVVVPTNSAELAADSAGQVEDVYVRTGDRVLAGDRLLQFDRSETASSVHMARAQLHERASELTRAKARFAAARTRLSRLRAGESWLSKQELDSAVTELEVAEADLSAARANLGVSRIALKRERTRSTRQTLVAPFAGTVISLGVDEGDSVVPGQVVLRILSEQKQVRFALPPDDVPAFDSNSSLPQVTLQLQDGTAAVTTVVDALRPEVDPSAQLVFASATLPQDLENPQRWIPGARVTVTPVATGNEYKEVSREQQAAIPQ